MKKLICMVLALCMMLSVLSMTVSAETGIAGDVNSDGKVTPYDALQVQAHLHGALTLTPEQIARAVAACESIPTLSTAHIVSIFFKPLVGKSAIAPEEDGLFHIRSADDMALLRSFPYAGFSLDANINMAGVSWTPGIFNGVLFGNGHTISDLNVSASSSNANAGALFIKLGSELNPNAAISNLTLASPSLKTTATHRYVGLVCGTNYGTISDVSIVNGSISGAINATTNYAGTFAGVNYGTVNYSSVASDCLIDYTAETEGRTVLYVNGNGKSIPEMLNSFHSFEGSTPQEKAISFCKAAGLTDAEINAIITNIMG